MRTALLVVAALAVTPAVAKAQTPSTSWGRAGVGFDEYRLETTICLREAEAVDLTDTDPARALVIASRRIENALGADMRSSGVEVRSNEGTGFDQQILAAGQAARALEQARPEQRLREARDILQERLDACLINRGYRRFQLTDAQRRALRELERGQPERQQFLHRLASDPAVLAAQSVE